jgi:hypothetical protein
MLLLSSIWSTSQPVQIRLIEGDSVILMQPDRLVRVNILLAKCDSVAEDNYFLTSIISNRDSTVAILRESMKDLSDIVRYENGRYLLEQGKNNYYIQAVENERKKRIKWIVGLGVGILFALLI